MMEGELSYIDHNELINIGVPVLVEPAVGERHLFSVLWSNSALGCEYQDPFRSRCSICCTVSSAQYLLYCKRNVRLVELCRWIF